MRYTECEELNDYINRCITLEIDINIDGILCEIIDNDLVGVSFDIESMVNNIENHVYKFPSYIKRIKLDKKTEWMFDLMLSNYEVYTLDLNEIEYFLGESKFVFQCGNSVSGLKTVYANKCLSTPLFMSMESVENLYINSVKELRMTYNYTHLKYLEARGAEVVRPQSFYRLKNLEYVYLDNAKDIYQSFYDNYNLKVFYAPKAKMFIDNFNNMKSLEEVNLDSIDNLAGCFQYCESLKKVNLGNCKSIGSSTFIHCDSLEKMELPKVENLKNLSFMYCERLKELYLPSLQEINGNQFTNCYALRKIYIGKQTKRKCDSKSISFSFRCKMIWV